MSDVAVTWAKAQDCPTSTAKAVLICLASYCDADGLGWAKVSVLALEAQGSDRTVQRALKALEGAGLIVRTHRSYLHQGKNHPLFQLSLDSGFASTRERIKAARAAARDDTGVTPSKGADPSPVSPQDVTSVTPRGDTGDALIGKGITQDLKVSVRACADAMRRWGSKAPERVSPQRVAAAWDRALERSGWSGEDLDRAVAAAVARDPDFGRGKAMNLDRWLDEDRFLAWLLDVGGSGGAGGAGSGGDGAGPVWTGPVWTGPGWVAEVVRSVMGARAVASYLDPAGWDEAGQRLLVRTGTAAAKLTDGVGAALAQRGVTIAREAAHG